MRLLAHAKVNLSLRVRSPRADGLHPLSGLFTSISWSDELWIDTADEDSFAGHQSAPVPDGHDNLAWQAALAVRSATGSATPLTMRLRKRIPVAAGLGGGSADAAAALGGVGEMLGAPSARLTALAPGLGSDVPFCFTGGFALVEGVGDRVTSLGPLAGFALAVVVPPVDVATPAVFAAWDRMGGSPGPALAERDVPPTLRGYAPLANDLTSAAIEVAPLIADWREELENEWGRVVALSGSGAALYSYFMDGDEAEAALDAVPRGARAAEAVVPVVRGWDIVER